MTVSEFVDRRSRSGMDTPLFKDETMVGQKNAYWDGQRLHVSPAMASLMTDPNELERVSQAITVKKRPRVSSYVPDLPF